MLVLQAIVILVGVDKLSYLKTSHAVCFWTKWSGPLIGPQTIIFKSNVTEPGMEWAMWKWKHWKLFLSFSIVPFSGQISYCKPLTGSRVAKVVILDHFPSDFDLLMEEQILESSYSTLLDDIFYATCFWFSSYLFCIKRFVCTFYIPHTILSGLILFNLQ